MKRLYVALAFLAVIIGLCVFEQVYIRTFYKTTMALAEQAIAYTDSRDFDNAYATCKALSDYWAKKYPCLTSMVEHGVVNDAGNLIGSLPDLAKTENDALRMELVNTKNQLSNIYNIEQIRLENILSVRKLNIYRTPSHKETDRRGSLSLRSVNNKQLP